MFRHYGQTLISGFLQKQFVIIMDNILKNINKLPPDLQRIIEREMRINEEITGKYNLQDFRSEKTIYETTDGEVLPGFYKINNDPLIELQTLDELLERDKKREEDGFPRRIRLGKLIKPTKDKKGKVVVVPTTTEPKFYHDDSITEELDDEEQTGGSGEGEEGEVIGEQQPQPQQGEGEGQGAGQGEGAEHEISSNAFDLGKILTEKFQLPNLKIKGRKRAFSKYIYELTDINRRFGQLIEKKLTLKRIVETNILLGRIDPNKPINTEDFIISPDDLVYRIFSQEKDFETQAVVFFLRDYSGSMQGKPTEVVSTQHLFIYSWLIYQYKNNVMSRFILHDTEAKEVPDFYTYYQSQVAGGTHVAPAFKLTEKIISEENLAQDYNIYIFYGTDGDDWDDEGEEFIESLKNLSNITNRIGITVVKNLWGGNGKTNVEQHIEKSNLLQSKPEHLRLDEFSAEEGDEKRIIESIKKLVS